MVGVGSAMADGSPAGRRRKALHVQNQGRAKKLVGEVLHSKEAVNTG